MFGLSLLPNLLLSDRFSPVEGSSSDRVELQVLLESSSSLGPVGKSLLLVIDGKVVEKWDHNDVDCERNSRHIHLGSVLSTCEGGGQDSGTEYVVLVLIKAKKGTYRMRSLDQPRMEQRGACKHSNRTLLPDTFFLRGPMVLRDYSFFIKYK